MRRYMLWYVLAVFWAVIAIAGFVKHHPGNAALEGAVAVLFVIVGITVKRRDAATASRSSNNRVD